MANTQYVSPYEENQTDKLLVQTRNNKRISHIIWFLVITVVAAYWLYNGFHLDRPGLTAGLMIAIAGLYVIHVTHIDVEPITDTKLIGDEGERIALEILSALPDEYTVLNDVRVPNPKSRTGNTQIDYIVIGPNGCFVVEVKYHRGMIVNTQDRWVVTKTSIKGHQYTKEVRNPMKQVASQIKALRSYTKTMGYTITVNPIIYFAHPTSSVHCQENNSIAVIHLRGLTRRILETPKPRYLSERTIQRFKEDMIRLKQAQTEEKKEEEEEMPDGKERIAVK